jgi:hypothetical protein
MIRRIDHVIAVVDDAARTRARLLGIGCPLVWDGRSGEHRDVMFSIGAVRLELLATAAFDGWPALADLAARSDQRIGFRVAALDPGDLDQTIGELRGLGIEAGEPEDGQLSGLDDGPASEPVACWRNAYVDGLRGLLPGLPSFLCQILTPAFISPASGRQAGPVPAAAPGVAQSAGAPESAPAPDVPSRFVELRVGVQDPASAAPRYEQVLGARALAAADGSGELIVPIADTPIRLVRGSGLQVVVAPTRPDLPLEVLTAELPGLRWAGLPEAT